MYKVGRSSVYLLDFVQLIQSSRNLRIFACAYVRTVLYKFAYFRVRPSWLVFHFSVRVDLWAFLRRRVVWVS